MIMFQSFGMNISMLSYLFEAKFRQKKYHNQVKKMYIDFLFFKKLTGQPIFWSNKLWDLASEI